MSLPQGLSLPQMQTTWATELNPLLSNPLVNGILLKNIDLITGSNAINHRLGRKLQGWIITSIDGAAQIYDTQASNQIPQLTLLLTSDADVTVSLWVF